MHTLRLISASLVWFDWFDLLSHIHVLQLTNRPLTTSLASKKNNLTKTKSETIMKSQGFNIRFNGIVGFAFMVLIFVALFFLAKGVFTLLSWIAPVLIILTLVINPKTILNYLRFMLSLLQRNPLGGILGIILSVVGFPILSGVLFGKAILDRKVRKLNQAYKAQESSEFVEYEEVIRPDRETKLDLPPLEKEPQQPKENPYKDLF